MSVFIRGWLMQAVKEKTDPALVFYDQAPQGTKNPVVILQHMSTAQVESLDRCKNRKTLKIQIRCYECSRKKTVELKEKIVSYFLNLGCGEHAFECDDVVREFWIERAWIQEGADTYERLSNASLADYGATMMLELSIESLKT